MAKKSTRSSSRTSRSAGRAAPKKGSGAFPRTLLRVFVRSLRWLGRVSRPQTAAEGLACVLVCLGLITLAASSVASVRSGERPGPGLFWSLVLFALALAARLSPWWRSELRAMTMDRARGYAGSALLVFVLLSLSWHLLSGPLGLGDDFLLLGPLSRPPAAVAVLVVMALVAGVLILNIPVHRWSAAGYREGADRLAAARERRMLAAAKVEFPPIAMDQEQGALVSEVAVEEMRKAARSGETSKQLPLKQPALPPIEIFDAAPKLQSAPVDLEHKAQRIQETLASFNVSARVVGHHSGPVVTQFDVQPARGVKVRKITELQNDLALALAAPTIRIQAPVPAMEKMIFRVPYRFFQ